ncbi:hypothetical protein FS749_012348, partial [Ceratobasidium sp. UAMH 11750]
EAVEGAVIWEPEEDEEGDGASKLLGEGSEDETDGNLDDVVGFAPGEDSLVEEDARGEKRELSMTG